MPRTRQRWPNRRFAAKRRLRASTVILLSLLGLLFLAAAMEGLLSAFPASGPS